MRWPRERGEDYSNHEEPYNQMIYGQSLYELWEQQKKDNPNVLNDMRVNMRPVIQTFGCRLKPVKWSGPKLCKWVKVETEYADCSERLIERQPLTTGLKLVRESGSLCASLAKSGADHECVCETPEKSPGKRVSALRDWCRATETFV